MHSRKNRNFLRKGANKKVVKLIAVFLVISKTNLTASTKIFRKFLRKEGYGIIIKLLMKIDK